MLRVEQWLADPDGPRHISAEIFQSRDRRKRALAEIDGIYAGLTFLDKVEKSGRAPGPSRSAAGFDMEADLAGIGSCQLGYELACLNTQSSQHPP